MALTGGGVFVANGKKFVQQPACLPPASKSAYRIGFRVVDVDSVTLTGNRYSRIRLYHPRRISSSRSYWPFSAGTEFLH